MSSSTTSPRANYELNRANDVIASALKSRLNPHSTLHSSHQQQPLMQSSTQTLSGADNYRNQQRQLQQNSPVRSQQPTEPAPQEPKGFFGSLFTMFFSKKGPPKIKRPDEIIQHASVNVEVENLREDQYPEIVGQKLFEETAMSLPEDSVPPKLKFHRIVHFKVISVDSEDILSRVVYSWIPSISEIGNKRFYIHGDVRFKQVVSVAQIVPGFQGSSDPHSLTTISSSNDGTGGGGEIIVTPASPKNAQTVHTVVEENASKGPAAVSPKEEIPDTFPDRENENSKIMFAITNPDTVITTSEANLENSNPVEISMISSIKNDLSSESLESVGVEGGSFAEAETLKILTSSLEDKPKTIEDAPSSGEDVKLESLLTGNSVISQNSAPMNVDITDCASFTPSKSSTKSSSESVSPNIDVQRTQIDSLDISVNRLAAIDLPSWCMNLLYLDLSSNLIKSTDGLSLCKSLVRLNVSDNYIDSFFGIRGCLHLKELFIAGNRIQEFPSEIVLSSVRFLDISANDLMSLHNMNISFPGLQQLVCNNNQITEILGIEGLQLNAVDFAFNLIKDILPVKEVLRSFKESLRKINLSKNPVTSDEYYVFHLIDACRSLTHVDNQELEPNLVFMLKLMSLEANIDDLSEKLNTFYTQKVEEVYARHDRKRIDQLTKEHEIEVSFNEQLHSLNSAVHGIINYIVEKSKGQKESVDESKWLDETVEHFMVDPFLSK